MALSIDVPWVKNAKDRAVVIGIAMVGARMAKRCGLTFQVTGEHYEPNYQLRELFKVSIEHIAEWTPSSTP